MALKRYERFRRAVMILAVKDYTPAKIAEILGVSEDAVRTAAGRTKAGKLGHPRGPERPKPARCPAPADVLAMFRAGLDTRQMSRKLGALEADIANALAQARDAEYRNRQAERAA